MKLYKVILKGMQSAPCSTVYGVSYVIADNTDKAYKKVRKYLDERDLGFLDERELDSIHLLAEACDYPNCGTILFYKKIKEDCER